MAAQATLESAQKKLDDLKKPDTVDVRNARASLESARAGVKSAEAKVKSDKDAVEPNKPSSAQVKADEAKLPHTTHSRRSKNAVVGGIGEIWPAR